MFDELNVNLDGYADPNDMDTLALVFETLAAYAQFKARAMRYRLAGKIDLALLDERRCERYYKTLPEWAKW